MPPKLDDDWSDSDEEELPDVETSVLLGIPDGTILKQEDIDDAAVSRLGGYPALLPRREPPLSSAKCKNCSSQMELLVQLWCPLEESPYDRALYVWGCARSSCQRKEGSIRAFRGLRRNDAYAVKLEQKHAKREEARLRREAEAVAIKKAEEEKKERAKVNPFSMSAKSEAGGGLFGSTTFGAPVSGIGTQLFGTSLHTDLEAKIVADELTDEPPPSDSEDEDGHDGDGDTSSSESEVVAFASNSSVSSPWRAGNIPAYTPPQYLSTDSEYLPVEKNKTSMNGVETESERDTSKKESGDAGAETWNVAMEGYENSLDMDHVFERFLKRVNCEGEQCIRYDLGGTPLPYASDATFKSLFLPSPVNGNSRRTYEASSPAILSCPFCGGPRVFECQLMPNLINVLKTSTTLKDNKAAPRSDEERKRELERLLKGKMEGDKKDDVGGEVRGMEWGTCMVFSCQKDCCLTDGPDGQKGAEEAKECWREELVLVQWEE